jgi:phosphate transport system ATP-binding protein
VPIVIVRHNIHQAARIAENTGFFLAGSLVEYDKTDVLFENPAKKETEDYLAGRFG